MPFMALLVVLYCTMCMLLDGVDIEVAWRCQPKDFPSSCDCRRPFLHHCSHWLAWTFFCSHRAALNEYQPITDFRPRPPLLELDPPLPALELELELEAALDELAELDLDEEDDGGDLLGVVPPPTSLYLEGMELIGTTNTYSARHLERGWPGCQPE